jgi:hypothetical protein
VVCMRDGPSGLIIGVIAERPNKSHDHRIAQFAFCWKFTFVRVVARVSALGARLTGCLVCSLLGDLNRAF